MENLFYRVNINELENQYIFPSTLVNSARLNNTKNIKFVKIGAVSFGGFAYQIQNIDSKNKVVEVLYIGFVNYEYTSDYVNPCIEFILKEHDILLTQDNFTMQVGKNCRKQLFKENKKYWFKKISENIEVKLDFKKNKRAWQKLSDIIERNARMLKKQCSLEIKQLSLLSEKDKDKIRNKDFPEWADPYNQGYYTSELSSQNMVLFSSNQPIAWVNSSIQSEYLLVENLWSDKHDLSTKLSYYLLTNLLRSVNDWDLSKPFINIRFGYRNSNHGMHNLSKRLKPFISTYQKVFKLEVLEKKNEK